MSITDTATFTLVTDADGLTVTLDGEDITSAHQGMTIDTVSYPLTTTRRMELDGSGLTVEELTEWEETDAEHVVIDALMVYADNQHETRLTDVLELAGEVEERHVGSFDTGTREDALADYVEDLYPEAELPEWARPHYGSILTDICRDLFLGGDYWEAHGYLFRSY